MCFLMHQAPRSRPTTERPLAIGNLSASRLPPITADRWQEVSFKKTGGLAHRMLSPTLRGPLAHVRTADSVYASCGPGGLGLPTLCWRWLARAPAAGLG